ncbi:DUF4386 family protein [Tropicimonas marinistellae]|uniref:DUF4386 family protein n=1 Tax=Tropicimonas marinistellae TaxID=1739787 RepID=UPI000830894B|nr:DUF4386 family protein [Tropicimonas marinistellae]
MAQLGKIGGFAALYLGLAYAAGIGLFLVVLDLPSVTTAEQKLELVAANALVFHGMHLAIYVIFGVVLTAFVFALHESLKDVAPMSARFASVLGFIWAGLLIASGMVTIAGIDPTLRLMETDPSAAALYWSGIETVAEGVGLGQGEILGGLMTLIFSLAALRGGIFPKILNYLGIVVGMAGLVSVLPGLHDVAALFGITQMVWFIWLGAVFLRC